LLAAQVEEANFLGDSVLLKLAGPAGAAMLARASRDADPALLAPGALVGLAWDTQDIVVLEEE
jgi:hypothetical protein